MWEHKYTQHTLCTTPGFFLEIIGLDVCLFLTVFLCFGGVAIFLVSGGQTLSGVAVPSLSFDDNSGKRLKASLRNFIDPTVQTLKAMMLHHIKYSLFLNCDSMSILRQIVQPMGSKSF